MLEDVIETDEEANSSRWPDSNKKVETIVVDAPKEGNI